jgi:hypothetical protein
MPAAKPFPSSNALIQIADIPVSPALPVWTTLKFMTGWDTSANEEANETDVFAQTDPVQNIGRERLTFALAGLLADANDSGQVKLQTHIAARDYFLLQVLWDGTNGWYAQVRCTGRRGTGRAGNGFAEYTWDYQVLPSTVTAVLAGPVI